MKTALYSAVSLFSGCGGSDLGMASAGIETVWANEISEPAAALYERVTGARDVMECADVRDIDQFPDCDVLVGCYPCQGYSQGGKRDEHDGRNFLYREFDRALRQTRPLAFIVENVDGMRFAHNHSRLQAQLVRFRSAGYSVTWDILDAKDYGLAQDRRRLFLVGIRTKEARTFVFPRPTHGPGCDVPTPYRTLRDVIWKHRRAPEGSYCPEPLHWYYLSRNRRRSWGKQARCVVAHWRHVGLHPSSPPLRRVHTDKWEFTRAGKARRYSYRECAALQGFPAPARFSGVHVRQRFRAIGNAVPPPLFSAVASALVTQLQA